MIREHYEKRPPGLVEATYNMLLDRAIEIGARDMPDARSRPAQTSPEDRQTQAGIRLKNPSRTGNYAENHDRGEDRQNLWPRVIFLL